MLHVAYQMNSQSVHLLVSSPLTVVSCYSVVPDYLRKFSYLVVLFSISRMVFVFRRGSLFPPSLAMFSIDNVTLSPLLIYVAFEVSVD